jgi:hypothetical protein
MTTIPLPLRGREDICLYHFDEKTDADKGIQRICDKLTKRLPFMDTSPHPVLRVIPLSNRAAYQEALQIAIEAFAKTHTSVWIESVERARFGFTAELHNGKHVEHRQTIRIVQILLN